MIKAMTVEELINKLIGPIQPVGETNADDVRFENLKNLCELTEGLINRIHEVVWFEDRVEYSMKRAGKYAVDFLNGEIASKVGWK